MRSRRGPLDAGQRNRWKRFERRLQKWKRRLLKSRRFLMTVLAVAVAIVKLVRLIRDLFIGS
jgi:hypothetical protein